MSLWKDPEFSRSLRSNAKAFQHLRIQLEHFADLEKSHALAKFGVGITVKRSRQVCGVTKAREVPSPPHLLDDAGVGGDRLEAAPQLRAAGAHVLEDAPLVEGVQHGVARGAGQRVAAVPSAFLEVIIQDFRTCAPFRTQLTKCSQMLKRFLINV